MNLNTGKEWSEMDDRDLRGNRASPDRGMRRPSITALVRSWFNSGASMDRYTKVVLTVIAASLVILATRAVIETVIGDAFQIGGPIAVRCGAGCR
jgi:hypothetical protein